MKVDYDSDADDMPTDPLPNQNQKYVLMSFVSPEGQYIGNKGDMTAFKVRGVFSSYEKARDFIKIIQESDKSFDIYITKMAKWVPFITKEMATKMPSNYVEEELQKLVNQEVDNEAKKALDFDEDTKRRIEQAKQEGSKEGQVKLDSLEYKQNMLEEINRLRDRLMDQIAEMQGSNSPCVEIV